MQSPPGRKVQSGLYRVTSNGSSVAVSSVSTAGSVVTLRTAARVFQPATVSYGYARAATAAWVEDVHGTPVPVFERVPVGP